MIVEIVEIFWLDHGEDHAAEKKISTLVLFMMSFEGDLYTSDKILSDKISLVVYSL